MRNRHTIEWCPVVASRPHVRGRPITSTSRNTSRSSPTQCQTYDTAHLRRFTASTPKTSWNRGVFTPAIDAFPSLRRSHGGVYRPFSILQQRTSFSDLPHEGSYWLSAAVTLSARLSRCTPFSATIVRRPRDP